MTTRSPLVVVKFCVFAFLFGLFFIEPSFVLAQFPPLDRFPDDSDDTVTNHYNATMNNIQSQFGVGQGIGNQFSRTGGKFNAGSGQYEEHPWGGTIGRNIFESTLDWFEDSFKINGLPTGGNPIDDFTRFMRCMEPRMILPFCLYCMPPSARFDGSWSSCPYRNNLGEIWSFWWPEDTIEINNFAISAYNPILSGRVDLLPPLARLIHTFPVELYTNVTMFLKGGVSAEDNFPSGLRDDPHKGKTQVSGVGPLNNDQVVEAHVYRTRLAKRVSEQRDDDEGEFDLLWAKIKIYIIKVCVPSYYFWYNGYEKGNSKCFASATPEDGNAVKMWTEEIGANLVWRFPELSLTIEGDGYYDGVYNKSVPAMIPVVFGPAGMILEGQMHLGSYIQRRACMSYRAEVWDNRYGDLEYVFGYPPEKLMFGVIPDDWDDGNKICYRGGGQLYPVTGRMAGMFSPIPTAAYFARRALHLAERIPSIEDSKTNVFSDRTDKLQRVHPEVTECFKVNDIDPFDRGLFPSDELRPDHLGSIRYVHWNMRIACTCPYRGVYPAPIPFNFVFWLIPQGQGCHNYEDYDEESRGDEENQGDEGFGPFIPWPYTWPILPTPYAISAMKMWPFL